ncbi:acyl-CoA dehydrogenase C-terminal domain-containing protein [Chitinimonas sp. BJYL2]|uniref:acyl-CoA dehydrogenase C-terminal domain-containing protein n=1 Tax=Chitinimonas sp. BJYL2 TaxID=2976696 RepID=UPI0022B3E7E9|nr:acyl-CoA dehydrogenase C-terminal domain-containing protein [Chitinimonas sp. BJYL2]
MTYQAPLADMRFVMNELAGLSEVSALPGYEDVNPELADAILEEAAKFAENVLAPLNRVGDQHGNKLADAVVTTAPGFKDAYTQYVENGWGGLHAPADFGGQGMPSLIATAVEEMWKASNMAFSLCPLLTLGAIAALEHHGSDELKTIYLPKMVEGVWTGTMNLTEPQAGSDLSLVKSRAVPVGDGTYKITGQKIFITWGEHDMAENIVHLVLARLPDAPAGVKGISLFVVPKFMVNADGSLGPRNDLQCVSIEHKMGIHGSPTCVMSYGDNGGAIGYLVGEANRGLGYMFTMMNAARLGVGVEGMALASAAYQKAVGYARDRLQSRELGSDNPNPAAIIRHPDVRRMLMTMRALVEAERALTYYACAALDKAGRHPDAAERQKWGAVVGFLTPIVKGWNTENASRIASLGVQVHGGMGYIEETGAAQYLRDSRISAIYEGTNGIQAMDLVGRKTASEKGATAKAMLAEVESVVAQLRTAGLTELASGLDKALANARVATEYVVNQFESQPREVAAGSVAYLELMGLTLGGWQMGRAALIAKQKLADGEGDAAFFESKLITANFYAAYLLPQTASFADVLVNGADAVLALADDAY